MAVIIPQLSDSMKRLYNYVMYTIGNSKAVLHTCQFSLLQYLLPVLVSSNTYGVTELVH